MPEQYSSGSEKLRLFPLLQSYTRPYHYHVQSIVTDLVMMICSSCMRRLSPGYRPLLSQLARRVTSSAQPNLRTFTTSTTCRISPAEPSAPAPHQGSPSDARHPPAATSTSAAQPFSTPRTPRPAQMAPASQPGDSPPVVSSVPAGTPLKGLSYMKNKPDPVALEDWQYPPWLWTLLQSKANEGSAADDSGDLYGELLQLGDLINWYLK